MASAGGANGGTPPVGAASAQGEAPGWRQRVNEQFIKRRQKPGMLEKNLAKVSQKIGPVRPVKLPILTKPVFADPAAEMRAALNKASFGQTAEQQQALANSAAAMTLSPSKPKTPRDASAAAAAAGAGAGSASARDSERQRELLFGSANSGRGAAPGAEDTKRAHTPPQQPALLPPGAQSFMQRNAAAAAAGTGAAAGVTSVLSPPPRSGRASGGGISVSLGPAPLSTAPLPKYTLPKADKLYELTATDPSAAQSGPPLTGLAALAANTSLHHTLPLELFDSDETDKKPEEWVALSASKYGGAGVPARSLYYHNRQWKWAPCRVMEWNAVSEHFIITFPPNTHTKDVKRLSILFDGEDEKRFLARVERCRLLRDEAMSHRRLLQFIDHQPGDMFAPLQKTAVHGIIANLMRHSEKLVQARQKTVENSLAEVRSEYARAMKAAIIDYKRRSPDEERKLLPLGLPPRTVPKAAPALAVIDIPARLIQKAQVMRYFQTPDFHYTIHAAATAVILNLQTAWHSSLCRERFFQMDHAPAGSAGLNLMNLNLIGSSGVSSSPLELPMTIEDYVMKQEIQFTSVRDKLVSDWRSHVISMIRETLKDIFHIYVDDRAAYDNSLFQRFLFMVQLMLRYQLAELVHQSLTDFAAFFERYAVRPPKAPLGGAVHYPVLPPATASNGAAAAGTDGSAPQPQQPQAAALDVKQPMAAPAPFKVMITADPSQAPAAGSVAAAAAALPAVEKVPRGSAAAAAAMLASARRASGGPIRVGAPRDDTDDSEQFLLPDEAEPPLSFPNPALYLHEFLSGAPSGPAAGLEDGVHPLFSFRMHAEAGEIAFTPRLESIEPAVLDVINIAEKVSNPGSDANKTKTCVFEIESLVVPLLNKEDKPMCTKRNSAFIFRHGLNLKLRVRSIIRENLKLPRALAALYAEHRFLLHIDPDAYVKHWFAGTRKKVAPAAADKPKRDDDKSRGRDAKKDKKDAPKVVTKADKEKEAAEEAKRRADAERDMWEERSVDDTKREIERFRQAVIDIQNKSPNECVFRLCQIDVRQIKAQLIERANAIATKLMHGLAEHVRAQNQKIALQFEEIKKRISRRPNDVHELAELKNLVEAVENVEIPRFQREIRAMQAKMAVLEDFQHRVSRDDFDLSWNVVRYPQYISEDLERTKERIQYDNAKFQKTLQSEQADFAQKLITMTEDVRRFADFGLGRVELMDEHTRGVLELNDALENAEKLVISFNDRDKLFGDPPTEYAELKELRRKFQPYFLLWNTTGHFKSSQNSWLGGQFLEVLQDPNEIERLVTGWHKLMVQLEKQFREEGSAKPAAVAADTLKHITAFKEHVPLIQWLRSPGLYQRHWERISKILNKQLDPENLTLQQILNLDVVTHRDEIEEECDFATKEFALENAKEKMRKAWETMLMQLQEYKSTGKFILINSEDAFTLLDDHLIKTQAMLASPYVHRFWEKAMDAWRNKLKVAQHRLSVWMQVQKAWMYLEPIFTSMDIKRSLAKEADRFQQLDRFWLGFMERAKASQKDLLTFCSENEENFQKLQGGCLDTINDIMNKLNLYLDSKRQIFPRFYFLSNDGLLSLLSQTKDPTSVQPHLSKCFDAIRLLEFSSAVAPTNPQGKLLIKGMHSVEGEFVPFARDVDPNDGSKRGNVELWLIDVENAMRESLRKSMYQAMVAYGNLPDDHTQWYFKFPAQVVLAVYRFMWSDAVNEALQHASGSGKALDVVKQHCDVQKRKLIELVQNPRLPSLHRQTLEALMVLELNGNSIVAGLRASQVRSDTDFNWIKELRYSYDLMDEPAAGAGADSKHAGHHHPTGAPGEDQQWTQAVLRVKMVNTTLDYQYEYLGNSSRLVITDLTTRCYQTLMTALKMHRGGAPEGPAGTGKTETVKDLSKALAIMCVVDNGSDSLTTRSMSRFFKGLASTGAWCCFDEFNRIDVEVLSVAAQQISGIQRAIIEKRKDVMFGDAKIALVPTCSVFVTMNPVGYSGRQELPDNLKTLFRTVAMILPEYRMIAEFRLMGSGYNSADTLAVKIVYALKLAQEQLSVQEHYDFGTRNIVSILKTAAGLKQKFPNAREDVLCVRAIRECNIPKLVSPDIPLFEGIMRDLFPDVPAAEADPIHDRLTAAIKRAMGMQKPPLIPTPVGIQKYLELYETILVRTGVMLIGPPFAGKSTALKVLAAALCLLADESAAANGGRIAAADAEHFNWVDCFFINPKAITKDQLFGRDDESKNEWTLGVLPVAMRAAVADQRSGRWKWVVLDGPVDSEWIENMNTVLDESRKLCLGSGDQIKLIDHMTMAFEVEDLAAASLATVSRCGMVYMEPVPTLWKQLVESFVLSLPASLDNYKADIRTLFAWIVPPCLEFIHRHCRLMLPTSDHALVAALTRMFASLLDEFYAAPVAAAAGAAPAADEKGAAPAADAAADAKESGDLKALQKKKDPKTGKAAASAGPARAAVQPANPNTDYSSWLESLFLFSAVWSLGCCMDGERGGRARFSNFFRDLVSGKAGDDIVVSQEHAHRKVKMPYPEPTGHSAPEHDGDAHGSGHLGHHQRAHPKLGAGGETVYDYVFSKAKGAWDNWAQLPDFREYKVPDSAQYYDIIVPTVASVRTEWLLELLITHQKHVLLTGPTGTGKSLSIRKTLLHGLDDTYLSLFLSFSARTTANRAQDIIDGSLDRRWKGVIGPPVNKRYVIFLDDLNMPTPDAHGAQPPIEILRQWMDYGGWYDRTLCTFQQLVDIQFVAALGPPSAGGGRSNVTNRYLRHYNNLCLTPYDSDSLRRIFSVMLDWWMRDFKSAIRLLRDPLLDASIGVYDSVLRELLPTPAKSHYTFNMRDLSRLFHGLMASSADQLRVPGDLIKLWVHETTRVFADRLVDAHDTAIFFQAVAREFAPASAPPSTAGLGSVDGAPVASVGAGVGGPLRIARDLKDKDLKGAYPWPPLVSRLMEAGAASAAAAAPAGDEKAPVVGHRRRMSTLAPPAAEKPLLYCDFSQPEITVNKPYLEVTDMDRLCAVCEGYLVDYNNESNSKNFDASQKSLFGPADTKKAAAPAAAAGTPTNAAGATSPMAGDRKDEKSPVASAAQNAQTLEKLSRNVNAIQSGATSSSSHNTAKKNMDLVLFTAAVEHISRISRILRQPRGHALLVGVGGSGRQSLCRLAAFVGDIQEVYQVEVTKSYKISDWQDDLRDMLKKAGTEDARVVFLFTDAQIKTDAFLEDINSFLQYGEIPNLFNNEQQMAMSEAVVAAARKVGKAQDSSPTPGFAYFLERCRHNVHIVLCLSPVGDAFRNRLRMFPSLVNYTTIDWFHPWPQEALSSVATRFFKDIDGLDDATKSGIVDLCTHMQLSTTALSEQFARVQRRHNYVTASSFLEMIQVFKRLFLEKRADTMRSIQKYKTGVDKLEETAAQVDKLNQFLDRLQPELKASRKETEELANTIQLRSTQVAMTKKIVAAEQKERNEQKEVAAKWRQECEAQLEEAMPAMQQAQKALKSLKKPALDELKSTRVPSQGLLLCMEALCVMMKVEPRWVGQAGQKKPDFWEPAKKKLLSSTKLFDKMRFYPKDNIEPDIIAKVRLCIKNPNFSPAQIAIHASHAAEAICKWVIAMEIYDRVIKKVQPKRELVAQAEKREASLSAQVAQKEAELKDVQALLDDLNTQLDIVNEKKKGFEAQEKECRERLDRAQKLTTGLKENKENWVKHAVRLEHEFQTLIGNIVLSSGVIAYLGAFTSSYRDQALKGWIEQLSRHHITCSAPNFALSRVLADPLQEVKWELQGLPRDPFSFDNAVILSECNRVGRFCLLIDPHEQAVHWIRRFHAMRDAEAKDALTSAAVAGAAGADGKTPAAGDAKAAAPAAAAPAPGGSRSKGNERRLQEIKHNDTPANWKNRLQACMISGLPLLVEGVGEALDPILEPLLQKQKFKQNNRWMIRLGNEIVDFNPDFRLYLLSKMHNPHYPPEISTKVTIINFMVTQKGLEDQMLSKIMALEEAKLEENRIKKVEETADLTEKKQFLDENILRHLNYSKGHILDDVALIQDLAKSKSTSANYEKRMKQAQASQEVITQRRAHYSSLAQHVAGLFFCISELSQIDPMYQYSLRWYMSLFVSAQQKGTPSVDLIEHKFNEMLYDNVCRSLFEKDKLLFSFLMCLNIQQTKKQIDADELRMLLTGGTALIDLRLHPNPTEVLDTATPTASAGASAGANAALVNTVISGAANAAAAGARASGGPLAKGADAKSGAAGVKGIDTKAAAGAAGADAKTSARGTPQQPASGSSGGGFDGESRKWLSDSSWLQLLQLSKLKAFSGLDAHFVEHQRTLWRAFYDSQAAVGVVPKLPVPWANTLNSFQRLLLLRCLRPDKLITAIQLYISEHMGERFIHPPHFNLSASYEDSSPYAPLIFVLSPGMDPYRDVHEFAAEKSPDRIFPISLGQGQEQEAEKLLRANFDKKSWVLLQNCHLLPSWMPKLEKLFEELCTSQSAEQASAASAIGATSSALPAIDTGFRLWLTSRPDHRFPVSILQNGVKMTNEPPKGIKENLAATYADMKEKYFAPANNKRVEELKKLTFGLSFFHALVQERRKFGPIGWNVGYDFNRSDLAISKRQLKFYLRSMLTDTVPIAALRYLIGDLNYGGRVTDRWDKRTLSAMLEDCLNENVLRDEFVFDPNGGGFYHPLSGPTAAHTGLDRYNKYIAELPTSDSAELFGLDENASITSAISEAKQLLSSVLAVQPRVPSDAESVAALTASTNRSGPLMVAPVVDARAAAIDGVAREILAQLPASFNLEAAAKKYPISYEECMNTVLVQELSRYNKLLDTIRSSLQNLQKAQAGLVLMSADLEQLSSALYDGRVAPSWMRVAYPSLKPLSAWILDLLKRIRMFTEWLRVGPPVVYCLSYFFNPQAFLTGTQQNYARGGPVSIDDLTFELEVVPDIQADHKVPPQDGCYVYGLYLEGARWDTETKALAEPFKRQLYSPMPVLFLKPIERSKQAGKRDQTLTYNCPVYRTSKRSGALQSTGLSSNFVIDLNLRSYHPERYWVKRGVALLLQLDT